MVAADDERQLTRLNDAFHALSEASRETENSSQRGRSRLRPQRGFPRGSEATRLQSRQQAGTAQRLWTVSATAVLRALTDGGSDNLDRSTLRHDVTSKAG